MKISVYALIALIAFGCTATKNNIDPVDYVNPFIGATTQNHGKTIPGAVTPFGLVQLSPNTITGGDNGSGYSYEHPYIEGFAFTQMSGIGWFGDLGNFLVTPTTGKLMTHVGRHPQFGKGYRSHYSKEEEKASAGYYSTVLTDYNIKTELTVSPHSGMIRFTFPENEQSRIQIDLARRVGGTSVLQYVKRVDENTIEGWMKCTPEGGGWGDGAGKPDYTVFFCAKFSKPMENYGVWSADIPEDWNRRRKEVVSERYDSVVANAAIIKQCNEKEGKHLGFYTEFPTKEGEEVLLKAGISFVDIKGARENLEAEIPDWNFERVWNDARSLWEETLGKIQIEGGTEEQKFNFYTALYRTMLDPRAMGDVDGRYPGGDGEIYQTDQFTKRTIFSGWDVFRSQFPLQTIINPTLVNDMGSLQDWGCFSN